MSELQDFETVGGHAEYRPTGELSLAQATRLITSGIAFARERQVKKLMVVTVGLAGFQPPNQPRKLSDDGHGLSRRSSERRRELFPLSRAEGLT